MTGVPTGEEMQVDNEKRLGSYHFCTAKTTRGILAQRSLYDLDQTFYRHSNLTSSINNSSSRILEFLVQHSAFFSFLVQHGVSLVRSKVSAI